MIFTVVCNITMVLTEISVTVRSFMVFLVVFLMVIKVIQFLYTPNNLPPGPLGFPIVGVLPKMGKKPYLTIQYWWRKYGDVYSLYMGTRFCIVINGVEQMKEALVKNSEIFSARPWNFFKKLTKNKGIVFTDGPPWKEHRRFTLSCLRDFGMGKSTLENTIHSEIHYFQKNIDNHSGEPFNPGIHIQRAVANIISTIIYGSRFDYEDKVFEANLIALDASVRNQSLLGMIQFLPFLEFLPKIMPKDNLLMKNVELRDTSAKEQLEMHKATCDLNSARDYIDAYLIHMHEMKTSDQSTTFDEGHLHRAIQDLFIAGTETVNTTLKWSLLFMAINQNIQEKVQEEIDDIIGQGRVPSMQDKTKMPYTEATIMECQRLGNIALFSVPRCTTEDTDLNGYHIPKGTWVFVNRWGTHMNTRYWKNPNHFDPTRFLTRDRKISKPDAFIPFGIGPRSCLGEILAKMELFLFFTAILQRYTVRLQPGTPIPSTEPQSGINMSPQDYEICMRER